MACEKVQKTGKRGVYRLFLNYLNQPILGYNSASFSNADPDF